MWGHLSTTYDMQTLPESEILSFPSPEGNFILPEEVIQEVQEGKVITEGEMKEDVDQRSGADDVFPSSGSSGKATENRAKTRRRTLQTWSAKKGRISGSAAGSPTQCSQQTVALQRQRRPDTGSRPTTACPQSAKAFISQGRSEARTAWPTLRGTHGSTQRGRPSASAQDPRGETQRRPESASNKTQPSPSVLGRSPASPRAAPLHSPGPLSLLRP